MCPIALPFLGPTGMLDVGYDPVTVGEDIEGLELDIGIGIEMRGVPPGVRGFIDE